MKSHAMLADDLTGALDAAAPFASLQEPVAVNWSGRAQCDQVRFAIDSESREIPPIEAVERMAALLPFICGKEFAYKKIDSLMRGNTITELQACSASGLFGTLVMAPAFPAESRITRNGQQLARLNDGNWAAAGPNLAETFQAESRLIGLNDKLQGGGVAICDAESDADLVRLAACRDRLVEPVLWCGSAGLARALSGAPHAFSQPTGGRRLVVVGSSHWVALAQTERLNQAFPGLLVSVSSKSEVQAAILAIGLGLNHRGLAGLKLAVPGYDNAHASAVYTNVVDALRVLPCPDILVVVGGATLYQLCRALEATRLNTIGEWMPGVAVSVLSDGLWQGTRVISKSGAFGGSDFLVDVLAKTERV